MRLEASDLLRLTRVTDYVNGLSHSHVQRHRFQLVIKLYKTKVYHEAHFGVHAKSKIESEEVILAADVLLEVLHSGHEDENACHTDLVEQELFAVVWVDGEHALR